MIEGALVAATIALIIFVCELAIWIRLRKGEKKFNDNLFTRYNEQFKYELIGDSPLLHPTNTHEAHKHLAKKKVNHAKRAKH